jgi:hypothetical protein
MNAKWNCYVETMFRLIEKLQERMEQCWAECSYENIYQHLYDLTSQLGHHFCLVGTIITLDAHPVNNHFVECCQKKHSVKNWVCRVQKNALGKRVV